MDHRRKIRADGISPCMRSRSLLCVSTIRSGKPDKPSEEDHRLVNWKRWLAERRKFQNYCQRVTGRDPIDLAFNSNERVRSIAETRELIELTSVPIPAYHDKYRGNPSFWRFPDKIPNRVDSCLPPISVTMTRKELFMGPEITNVALPELIRQEKDLPDLCKRLNAWERSEYLKKRREQLKSEIAAVQSKEPEIDHLLIKGNAIRSIDEDIPRVPVISISPVKSAEVLEDDPDEKIALRIQGKDFILKHKISKHTSLSTLRLSEDSEDSGSIHDDHNPPITWTIYFKTHLGEICQRKIVLENRGTRTIIYRWRPVKSRSPLFLFLPNSRKFHSPFFFNKNSGYVLPGQIGEILVFFRSKTSRVAVEQWMLDIEPKIHEVEFWFRLSGFVEPDPQSKEIKKSHKISEYLQTRMANSFIRKILEELIDNFETTRVREVPYKSLFLEREIFEARNPSYHYRPSLMPEFRKLYEEATNLDLWSWSLSLDELRTILLHISDPELRQEKQHRFFELCQHSFTPALHAPPKNDKTIQVYRILCSFANQFEVESDIVKNNCRLPFVRKAKSLQKSNSSCEYEINVSRGGSIADVTAKISLISFEMETPEALYKEIFFVRIYDLLVETIGKVCTTIDSFNNLHEKDK